jgi:hypothetical protein
VGNRHKNDDDASPDVYVYFVLLARMDKKAEKNRIYKEMKSPSFLEKVH